MQWIMFVSVHSWCISFPPILFYLLASSSHTLHTTLQSNDLYELGPVTIGKPLHFAAVYIHEYIKKK